MKSIGPRTLPCGIPLVTSAHDERLSLITILFNCLLSVRKASIHVSILPSMPYPRSFVSRRWWGTAGVKRLCEVKIDGVDVSPLVQSYSVQESSTASSCVAQDRPWIKPCCFGDRRSFDLGHMCHYGVSCKPLQTFPSHRCQADWSV